MNYCRIQTVTNFFFVFLIVPFFSFQPECAPIEPLVVPPIKPLNADTSLRPITIEFLVRTNTSPGKRAFKTGERGGIYTQEDELFFRFTNSRDGFTHLIAVNNDGVYFLFPLGESKIIAKGTHEVAINGKPQLYPLKNTRGDLFIIALFSNQPLDPEKQISSVFTDIKWLKDGKIDLPHISSRIPGAEVDYFRIFVRKPKPTVPTSAL